MLRTPRGTDSHSHSDLETKFQTKTASNSRCVSAGVAKLAVPLSLQPSCETRLRCLNLALASNTLAVATFNN